MAGTLTISTLSDGTNSTSSTNCIRGSAKAFVQFNGGYGNTAGVINNSYNVSSITVGGTGIYTINFTTAMPNANYSFSCGVYNGSSALLTVQFGTYTTSAFYFQTRNFSQVNENCGQGSLVIFD